MKKILLALMVSAAFAAVTGCTTTGGGDSQSSSGGSGGSGGGGSSGPAALAASGATLNVDTSGPGISLTKYATSADVTYDEQSGRTTVEISGGPYDNRTITFENESDTSTIDGKPVTVTSLGSDGASQSDAEAAFIAIDAEDNDPAGDFIAIYAGADISNLPTTGTATYTGSVVGVGMTSSVAGDLTGTATLDANFGTGGVSGTFSNLGVDDGGNSDTIGDIAFSGSMNTSTAAYSADTITMGGGATSADSVIEGAFFGDGATATSGYLHVLDQAEENAAFGVYQADR